MLILPGLRTFLTVCLVALFSIPALAADRSKAQDHYSNPKYKNDPDFVPDLNYPAPDTTDAEEKFHEMVSNLDPDGDFILDVVKEDEEGELTWTATKDKSTEVLGYFRNVEGYIAFQEGKFSLAELLIDVNSIDSSIPSRDFRIQNLFFKSFLPEMSTGILVLDKILSGSPYLSAIQNGATHDIVVGGLFTLGGETIPVKIELQVQWDAEKERILVKTIKPLLLYASDLGLDKNFPALMEECNHKYLANEVKINCKLSFE